MITILAHIEVGTRRVTRWIKNPHLGLMEFCDSMPDAYNFMDKAAAMNVRNHLNNMSKADRAQICAGTTAVSHVCCEIMEVRPAY